MIGTTLGKYRITQRLAAGGMGEVYIGEHELIGRKAAIKVLLPHVSQRQDIVERFFQEARATAAIGHPGIVDIFDFGYYGVDGRRAYLVMEFLEGETLSKRIKVQRRLPLDQCVRIMRRVASALGAAHDKGIVHRDLKPDNIFLVPAVDSSDGERIKILDFGIAKLQDSEANGLKTGTGVVMGTPAYMAPEQCRGAGRVDHRADLYSLGCILFEMTCGRRPFVAAGVGELIGMQQFKDPPRPSDIWPDIDREVEALILHLLEKHPEDRIQDTRQLRERLETLGGTTFSSLPPRAGTIQPEQQPPTPLPQRAAAGRPIHIGGPPATDPPFHPTPASLSRSATGQPAHAMPTPGPMSEAVSAHPRDANTTTLHSAASERHRAAAAPPSTSSSRWLLIAGAAAVLVGIAVGGVLMSRGSDKSASASLEEADAGLDATTTVATPDTTVLEDTTPATVAALVQDTENATPPDDTTPEMGVIDPGQIEMDPPDTGDADDAADARPDDKPDDRPDPRPDDDDDADEPVRPVKQAPAEVTLTIDSHPEGAHVVRNGKTVCKTRCTYTVKHGEYVKLVVRKPGYLDQQIKLKATRDRHKAVQLEKRPNIVDDVY